MRNGIDKLEREVLRWTMLRLKSWKKENPKGLLPFGDPQGVRTKAGYNMIRACLELEKRRGR